MAGSGFVVPGFQQWLKLTAEATYGTYDSGGAVTWVRIAGDDGCSITKTPARSVIRTADGQNRRLTNISAKYAVAGSLNTPFYPSQAQFWLDAACSLSASWNLPSFTADYFDGQVPRRYTGLMVRALNITSNSDQQYANCKVDFVCQKAVDGITLAQPAATVFPAQTVGPYLHSELRGRFLLNTTPVNLFGELDVSIKNMLSFKWYENQYIGWCQWCGRDVDMNARLAYIDTTWRDLYEAQTPQALTMEFYRSATINATLNFETFDILGSRDASRPLGDTMEETFGIEAFYDQANSTDFAYTVAYTAP